MALEFARRAALESYRGSVSGFNHVKDIRSAVQAFLTRQDVKEGTHRLNERHLSAFVTLTKIQTVPQITQDSIHAWLGNLKSRGMNPGGQSLALRILRTFCRFCQKRKWLSVYPFDGFKIPKSQFVGRYLSEAEREKLLSISPRYGVDRELSRTLTFGLYSLLRISQVFDVQWEHFKAPDQLWIPGIKGQDGRWITLHPKAREAMGEPGQGQVFTYWDSLHSFREAVHKKVKREKLHGVRFHETKHTGISALLEAGYSIPEVCRISGNSYRTISHYAHVNEQKVFEKWKSFEYSEYMKAAKQVKS